MRKYDIEDLGPSRQEKRKRKKDRPVFLMVSVLVSVVLSQSSSSGLNAGGGEGLKNVLCWPSKVRKRWKLHFLFCFKAKNHCGYRRLHEI